MPKYKILLSDDNKSLFQTLTEISYNEDVLLTCCEDWESAKVELMNDLEVNLTFKKFDAIILDGKGKLHDASKDSDARHLTESVNWLAQQNALGNFIPVVVFTGFHETISEFQSTNSQVLKIFSKGDQVNSSFKDVLSFLKKAIDDSPVQKFKSAFPHAYTFSDKYFSVKNKSLIQSLYIELKNPVKDFGWKKSTLDNLRLLNEAMVDTIPLNFYEPPYELRNFIEKLKREGSPKATLGNRTTSVIDYFNNSTIRVPGPIFNVIKNIYYTASTYTSHNEEKQSDYFPSSEMILGLVYSHFGCYHWFNLILNKK